MRFSKDLLLIFFFFVSILTSGAEYFQQKVSYTIHVSLNDRKHYLSADETLVYHNNSKNKLTEIYFHVWPAAYKNNNTFLAKEIFKSGDDRMLSASENDFGTIDSLDFRVNGDGVQWEILKDTIDICRLTLNSPLQSGDSITITTPFHVKIPAAYLSRLGHEGQAYFITQWYPKPAVYDENGWNYFSYSDQGEFYSEFGSYDVFITLPENYLLAATGTMIEGEKELAWLEKNDFRTRLKDSIHTQDSVPPSSKIVKTIHYKQDLIHDFAWFADKSWHVLRDTIELPDTKRVITSWAFFNNKNATYWLNVPGYIRQSIRYYSKQLGEYPYDQVTAVDVGIARGSGMEYPMITAIGNYNNPFELELTIVHEIGHNWLYGILGSNERCHPWMDEGIDRYYDTRFMESKYGSDNSIQKRKFGNFTLRKIVHLNSIDNRTRQRFAYLSGARRNTDQPPDFCSEKLSSANYFRDCYYKPSVCFNYLQSYLGESLFDSCMKDYYDSWKFRHPQPNDLKFIFENRTGKNLNWFFQDLIGTSKKLDYKITNVHASGLNQVLLAVKNTKQVSAPFPLSTFKKGKVISTNWVDGFSGKQTITLPCEDCDAFSIDSENKMPELYSNNNSMRMNGLLRKIEKLNFSFGSGIEKANQTRVFYSPVAGWNNYNKIMAGVVLHNISFLEKKFEYVFMPLFATGTNDFAGGGKVSYHVYPNHTKTYKITFETAICRYAFGHDFYNTLNNDFSYTNTLHFTKSDSKIIFSYLQDDRQDSYSNNLIIRNIFINRDIPYGINYKKQDKSFNYLQSEFRRVNLNPLKESLQRATITAGNKFLSVSVETQSFLTYGKINKGLRIRFFAGYISMPTETTYGIDYNMNLSGRDGNNDYLFDEVFLGRTEEKGIWSKQFVNDYAGFKTPVSFYRISDRWMTGVNFTSNLPGLLPFRLFANAGSFYRADQEGQFGKLSWEMGVDLPLIKDTFVIYFPFAYSNDIRYAVDHLKMKPLDLIRFELHLNLLNPLGMIKNIYND